MKRPAFQFYPGDWLRSTDLRSCSVGARGLWIDMLCLMHEGNPYGYLRAGNKDISVDILARITGCSVTDCNVWLLELFEAGVYSKEGGCVYSRRMIRDEKTRNQRSLSGIKSLNNPNVPRPRISSLPSLGVSPASAFASSSSSSIQKQRAKSAKKMNGEHVELPEWLPLDNWQTYLAMRARIRKPATPRAQRMILGKLDSMRQAGYNPAQILAESELKCWTSVYEPKG